MGIPLRLNTAGQFINVGPMIETSDFITPDDGLSLVAADIRLSKNGGAFATATGATVALNENGTYRVTLATANVNTGGGLDVQVFVANVLMAYDSFPVLAEAAWDFLYASGVAQANVVQYMDTPITETTPGNYANNNSTFWDNNDALTLRIVDDVGQSTGPTDEFATSETLFAGLIQSGNFASTNSEQTPPLVLEVSGGSLSYDLEFVIPAGSAIDGSATIVVNTNGQRTMQVRLFDFVGVQYDVFDIVGDTAGFPHQTILLDLDPKYTDGGGNVRMNFFTSSMQNTQTVTVQFSRMIHISGSGGAPSAEENAFFTERLLASTHGFDKWNGLTTVESLIESVVTPNTVFVLNSGNTTIDDLYIGDTLIIKDANNTELSDSLMISAYTAATRTVTVDREVKFTVAVGFYARIENALPGDLHAIKGTVITEPSIGRIAGNWGSYFSNGDVAALSLLDAILISGGSANKTIISDAYKETLVDGGLTVETMNLILLSMASGKFSHNKTSGNTTFFRQDSTTLLFEINTAVLVGNIVTERTRIAIAP